MAIESLIENMMDRGVLDKFDDSGETQSCTVNYGYSGTMEDIERLQDYGLTSIPPIDSQIFYVCLGGSQEYPIVVKVDSPDKRLKLAQPGEVALWSIHGNSVYLKSDGSVVVSSKDGKSRVSLGSDGKIKIANDSVELVDMLSQLVDKLSTATVATAIGPQKLSIVADLAQMKSKIDTMKG